MGYTTAMNTPCNNRKSKLGELAGCNLEIAYDKNYMVEGKRVHSNPILLMLGSNTHGSILVNCVKSSAEFAPTIYGWNLLLLIPLARRQAYFSVKDSGNRLLYGYIVKPQPGFLRRQGCDLVCVIVLLNGTLVNYKPFRCTSSTIRLSLFFYENLENFYKLLIL